MNKYLENRFRIYLIMQIMVVGAVIILFRTFEEKKHAAVIAGLLFLATPIIILFREKTSPRFLKQISTWGALIFLIFSAIPIFLLRILNWSEDFSSLGLLGFSAEQMHKSSNIFYLILLCCLFVDSYLFSYQQKNSEKQ